MIANRQVLLLDLGLRPGRILYPGVFDLKTMIAMIDDEMNDMLAVITAHVMLIFHILVRFIMICTTNYLLFVWTLRTICYLFGLVRSTHQHQQQHKQSHRTQIRFIRSTDATTMAIAPLEPPYRA